MSEQTEENAEEAELGGGRPVSEVIPEDEDRGGDGAIGGALGDTDTDNDEGGTGADDGGAGSQNM